jgi:uncharacterized membrane protein YeaQ/YmgE (transglycosylase-associated protein family)
MEIIAVVVLGLVLGAGARLLMPGPDPLGLYGRVALGGIGAAVGYVLALQFGLGGTEGAFSIRAVCVALTTSLAIVFLHRSNAVTGAA